jgi:glycosyltransferase involved in cell wall biosynthesis
MRVLMVHSRYRQRGGEDAAVDAEIAALGVAGVEVVPFFGDNDELSDLSALSAGLRTLWSTDVLRRLRRAIDEVRPDVMHVHNTFPGLSASVYGAARQRRIPVVQTLHNFRLLCANALLLRDAQPCTRCVTAAWPWHGIWLACYRESRLISAASAAQAAVHRILGAGAALVDRYIALTPSARETFIAGGLPAARIVVKPNVIPDPGPARADAPARQGLLFVGRVAPEKGLDTLLSALQTLDIPLTIAGAGPLADGLRRSAPPCVRWLGAVAPAEVSRLMRNSALLVFPSIAFENFPLAIAEAMAHGLPVLASDRGAMRDMIVPDRTGWLAEAAAPAAWRDALATIMASPERLAAAGSAARSQYESCYSPDMVIEQQKDIYRSVIGDRR